MRVEPYPTEVEKPLGPNDVRVRVRKTRRYWGRNTWKIFVLHLREQTLGSGVRGRLREAGGDELQAPGNGSRHADIGQGLGRIR